MGQTVAVPLEHTPSTPALYRGGSGQDYFRCLLQLVRCDAEPEKEWKPNMATVKSGVLHVRSGKWSF